MRTSPAVSIPGSGRVRGGLLARWTPATLVGATYVGAAFVADATGVELPSSTESNRVGRVIDARPRAPKGLIAETNIVVGGDMALCAT